MKPPDDRLDSWKEIAAYLKRDVTTVQRWEKREGMPVHRHLHDKLGSVYAFRTDLDAWARTRNLHLARDEVDRGPLAGSLGQSPGAREPIEDAEGALQSSPISAATASGRPQPMEPIGVRLAADSLWRRSGGGHDDLAP
jgi:hypothetical protein